MPQHHLGRENFRARVDIVFARVLGCRAVRGFKHGNGVAQIGARRNANAADLRCQGVRHVVAIEVERGNHAVLGRAQQNLLKEGVGNHVLDDDVFAGFGVLELHPRATVDQLGTKLLGRQRVAPIPESTLGELHDVALVHEGQAGLVVVNGVLQRLAHQALGAFDGHGLDADARGVREADFFDAHLVLQKLDELFGFVRLRLKFNASVDVFRVLTEDHHVGLLRLFHG